MIGFACSLAPGFLLPAHLSAVWVVRVALLLPTMADGEDVPAVEVLVAVATRDTQARERPVRHGPQHLEGWQPLPRC